MLTAEDIVAQLAPVLRAHADQGEHDRRLAPEAAEAMIDAGVFRAWIPKLLGGQEMEPLAALRMFEGIAHADSAAGWVASNSTNFTVLTQTFPDEGAAEIYASPRTVLAGTGFPPGTAIEVEGGYRLSGRWSFGSGCDFATWLLGDAVVMDGETAKLDDAGNPTGMTAAFPRSDVEIVDNWQTLGLRGTGSHDFVVRDVFVPCRRVTLATSFDNPGTAFRGPLYRLGLWLDGSRIAITALGIARACLEEFVDFAQSKTPNGTMKVLADRSLAQHEAARARAMIEAGRATVYQSVGDAWNFVQGGQRTRATEGISMGLASCYGVELAVSAVDIIQGLVGTSGIQQAYPFQRYFRDIHSINQHILANASRFESLGQLILGRESDFPFYYI